VISVELSRSGDRLQLAVYDDGEGFERSSGAPEGHLGLQILQDTVSAAGGRLDLHTAPRQGTEVLVSLPA
jgi:signal transduction histidine kinase